MPRDYALENIPKNISSITNSLSVLLNDDDVGGNFN